MRSSSHVLLLSFWVVLPLSSLALRPARQEGDDDDLQACQGGDCGVNITKDDERVLAGDGAHETNSVNKEALKQEVVAMDEPQAGEPEETHRQDVLDVPGTFERTYKADQSPNVQLDASVADGGGSSNGADVLWNFNVGGPRSHVKEIAGQDVNHINLASVEHIWALRAKGHEKTTLWSSNAAVKALKQLCLWQQRGCYPCSSP